jgi:hypothetical protein
MHDENSRETAEAHLRAECETGVRQSKMLEASRQLWVDGATAEVHARKHDRADSRSDA